MAREQTRATCLTSVPGLLPASIASLMFKVNEAVLGSNLRVPRAKEKKGMPLTYGLPL